MSADINIYFSSVNFDTTQVKELMIGFTSLEYIKTDEVIPLDNIIDINMTITLLNIGQKTSYKILDMKLFPGMNVCTAYDDVYHLTPELLVHLMKQMDYINSFSG